MATGFISPAGITKAPTLKSKYELYATEREAIKKDFAELGTNFDWSDDVVAKKLKGFARNVIKVTSQTVLGTEDLWSVVLPTERIQPGDTLKIRELSGVNVYYGTYGASVRMSRPQFAEYSATTNLKEVGLKLELTSIRTGKYSPSELADYTSNLITAWRNYLLFSTLSAMTCYSSGGDHYIAGTNLAFGTMNAAFAKMTDEADIKCIIGRRTAIHFLSTMTGWSEAGKEQFEKQGQVGTYGGVPVIKVNSFTDPDYGTVYPMDADDLWIFSDLPAGRAVIADTLRTADETIMQNETMNLYFRWDDGLGIFWDNRIVRVQNVT
jgi:hypothetical protein